MKICIFKSMDPDWQEFAVVIPGKTTLWYPTKESANESAKIAAEQFQMTVKDYTGHSPLYNYN